MNLSKPPEDGENCNMMALNDTKAGMEGLNREKINEIILEASRGSKYHQNQIEREKTVNERLKKLLNVKSKLNDQIIQNGLKSANLIINKITLNSDLSRKFLHIDLDSFYASVELLGRPDLVDKPVAVGSDAMLATSNYAARRFGVRAGMAGFIGRKLCPNLTIIGSNHAKYARISHFVRNIFSTYDPDFTSSGLDEAYLSIDSHLSIRKTLPENERTFLEFDCDFNSSHCSCHFSLSRLVGCDFDIARMSLVENTICLVCSLVIGSTRKWKLFGLDVRDVAEELRCRIKQHTRLTASVGVGPNPMLAKICTEINKPDGLYILQNPTFGSIREFMAEMPVRKVPGIGKVTSHVLNGIGISTCDDILNQRGVLACLFGSYKSLEYFLYAANGLTMNGSTRSDQQKSISVERTFSPTSNRTYLINKCGYLVSLLQEELVKEDVEARGFSVKLKTDSFIISTHSFLNTSYTQSFSVMSTVCLRLLKKQILSNRGSAQAGGRVGKSFRLLGLRAYRLRGASTQYNIERFMGSGTVDDEGMKNCCCACCGCSVKRGIGKLLGVRNMGKNRSKKQKMRKDNGHKITDYFGKEN